MTSPRATSNTQRAPVPELGPALGRLTAIPGSLVSAPPAPRDDFADLRLTLVGRLFDLAAAARRAADGEAAAQILTPDRLRHEWEKSAAQMADRVVARIGASLVTGAAHSGAPARSLRRASLTSDEVAVLRARLLGAGVPFVDGLSALDTAEAGSEEWDEALLASMRRLEEGWLTLERRAGEEEDAWSDEVLRLAAWRPSPWPRRILAAVLVMLFSYAGLVLGGFLPVPAFARPLAEWWWQHGG